MRQRTVVDIDRQLGSGEILCALQVESEKTIQNMPFSLALEGREPEGSGNWGKSTEK